MSYLDNGIINIIGGIIGGIFTVIATITPIMIRIKRKKIKEEEKYKIWMEAVNKDLALYNKQIKEISTGINSITGLLNKQEKKTDENKNNNIYEHQEIRNEYKLVMAKVNEYKDMVKDSFTPLKEMMRQMNRIEGDIGHIKELFNEKITTISESVKNAHKRIDDVENKIYK